MRSHIASLMTARTMTRTAIQPASSPALWPARFAVRLAALAGLICLLLSSSALAVVGCDPANESGNCFAGESCNSNLACQSSNCSTLGFCICAVPPCMIPSGCNSGTDCTSGVCIGGTCQAPTCSDGVTNQDETDVDCGGSICSPCADGSGCSSGSDCTSGVCSGGTCQAPTCSDAVKNQGETDVDCGGSVCSACGNGKGCGSATDCSSGVCSAGICQAPTCSDAVKNQDETDVDCGGSVCSACADGKGCSSATDCSSGVCSAGTCQAPTCSDGVKNQDETDVDCGGSVCSSCAEGQGCGTGTDCSSGVCSSGTCGDGDGVPGAVEDAAPNAGDGNGDETQDSEQSHVASFPSETGSGYITVVTSGGTCGPLTNVQALPGAGSLDPAFSYPFGRIGFKIPCAPAGGSVNVTVILHGFTTVPPGIAYRKYGPVPPIFGASVFYTLPDVVFSVGTVGSTSETALMASFTLTDGKLGDDTAVDGMIIDQGGPVVPVKKATPAASNWGLLALLLLLGGVGVLSVRRLRA